MSVPRWRHLPAAQTASGSLRRSVRSRIGVNLTIRHTLRTKTAILRIGLVGNGPGERAWQGTPVVVPSVHFAHYAFIGDKKQMRCRTEKAQTDNTVPARLFPAQLRRSKNVVALMADRFTTPGLQYGGEHTLTDTLALVYVVKLPFPYPQSFAKWSCWPIAPHSRPLPHGGTPLQGSASFLARSLDLFRGHHERRPVPCGHLHRHGAALGGLSGLRAKVNSSTGSPFVRCSSTTRSQASGVSEWYHVPSGYTTASGPPRQTCKQSTGVQ